MTEDQKIKRCLNCNLTDDEIPLVNLTISGVQAFICSRCLPILIHSPQKLIGKLEGADKIPSANHK